MRTAVVGLVVLALAATSADAAKRRRAPARKPAPPTAILHISSHLAEAASVRLDNGPTVTAPGYGAVEAPASAGKHTIEVNSSDGAVYAQPVEFKADALLRTAGKTYWCVNLLETGVQTYSVAEC